ncbi:hypothetical protein BaRGS_00027585 [Batillaria attramentaria]|uniref:S-adenosyl-L-methionine-dependent methyltransferase n=1 Tax=Batillaria attramentaria TaxID=370345 RepID=A0ABD0K263_9CAEN
MASVETNTPEKCDFCEEINRASAPSDKPKLTKTGAAILGVSGAFFVGVYAVTAPFLMPALRRVCLPFVPATTAQVKNVFTALAGRSGTLVDIGSGDGRITLEAAKRGLKSYGVELNTWLVLYSRFKAWRLGLSHTATFMRKDLWKADLSCYDNIVIFGVEQMMSQFEEKLEQELSPSGCVVACRFPLPSWEPVVTVGTGVDTVWLYKAATSKST